MAQIRHQILFTALALMALAAATTGKAQAHGQDFATPPPLQESRPVVYVIGQGLFYDSIVVATLPPRGPFQKLEMDGPSGLQTEFGPGDPGYLGGRWWLDVNGDDEMDGGDMYFMCPLLAPGRDTE
jgi:hypothetical protein